MQLEAELEKEIASLEDELMEFEQELEAPSELDSAEAIVAWIKDSAEEVKTGSDVTSVAFDLPPVSRVSPDHFIRALSAVLVEYAIRLPEDFANKIRKKDFGEYVFMADAREKHLPPREVELNTLPEISTMLIKGVLPIDGKDGFCRIFYDYSVKPGKYLPDGTIDFRDINRFPQVSKGDHVLRIYKPTAGAQGTDVYGLPVSPKPGSPFPIKIGEGLFGEEGRDGELEREFIDHFAAKKGIIVSEFDGPASDETLRSIAVQNNITVKNVDFSTGNLSGQGSEVRCAADVTVEGDIRGQFSVIIDGKLEVKGAVEGTTVDATGPVIATFVKNFIRSESFMDVGAARNATLISKEQVTVRKEMAECTISAPEIHFEPKGAPEVMCGRCTVVANRVSGGPLVVRNRMVIELGTKLFEQAAHLERQKQELQMELERFQGALRDAAAAFGQKLKMAKSLFPAGQQGMLSILKQLGTMVLLGQIPPGKLRTRLEAFSREHGEQYNSLLRQLFRMLGIQERIHKLYEDMETLAGQREELERELSRLHVEIHGELASAGQVVITCNGQEKRWSLPQNRKRKGFRIEVGFSLSDYAIVVQEGDADKN